MRARFVLGVAVVIALIALSTPSASLAQAGPATAPPDVGLGFGPTSVEPLSLGVPVFTAGDQIWVQSYDSIATLFITLTPPGGIPSKSAQLGPGQLADIYTITPYDPVGEWLMEVFSTTSGAASLVAITVENVSSPLEPSLVSAGVQGNTYSVDYGIPPTSAYDIQACSVGLGLGSAASFTLPSSVGPDMTVDLSGNAATVTVPYARVPFEGWFELHASRSFENGTSVVARDFLAAQTGVLGLGGSNSTVVATLTSEMSLRNGRYDLRAFVRGPSGLAAYEEPYLLVNGSDWVSLAGCTQLTAVTSDTFALSTNLDASNSTWPRSMYLMYSVGGVDSAERFAVPDRVGRIDVRTTGGALLSGTTLSLDGRGVQSWSSYGSNVYFVGAEFPAALSVGIGFEGVASEAFNLTVPGAYDFVSLKVEAGSLSVVTRSGGAPLANATIYVTGTGSEPATFSSGKGANRTLTLPPGEYNVTASHSGERASTQVEVTSGGNARVVLDVSPPPSQIPVYALWAVLVVGAALNIFVWREFLQRRAVLR